MFAATTFRNYDFRLYKRLFKKDQLTASNIYSRQVGSCEPREYISYANYSLFTVLCVEAARLKQSGFHSSAVG